MAASRPTQGCGSGALLGRFGVLLQALLALCAFCTLMCEYLRTSGLLLGRGFGGSSLLREWRGTGTGSPEKLWMLRPWRCSRPSCTEVGDLPLGCSWGVGSGYSLTTQTILPGNPSSWVSQPVCRHCLELRVAFNDIFFFLQTCRRRVGSSSQPAVRAPDALS